MGKLSAEQLYLGYESSTIVENLNLTIPEGEITILIGSNGCGKSTILRSFARLLHPKKGAVYLNGEDIQKQSSKSVAKKLAILPQGPQAPEGLTVKELCYYGRHPHKGIFSKSTDDDHEIVEWALHATGLTSLAERSLDALSGGQRQRAWIAMALSQGTDLLLLDEPTTYLDLAHQIEVLELLKRLNHEYGRTIIMVLHDLNQASRYADHLVSISDGDVYQQGPPAEVFTEDMLKDVFGLECKIISDPVVGTPMCVPFGVSKPKNVKKAMLG
ncbi:ABC transporter ATP-binding protein [Desertibacillus haloalkaliphilus]|uniref:ABC transporter ATP-binding protein n=1 Tax=Desertibacillus haloalkaliphilus TaxID=1328930 RepID=UPI001C27B109|nr:ABC transporter ATP-binding protein [Desertibacillus haloalkaliphilus]MBU8905409.1 ABC transporter ATP-binding protein [Desertibacillus haloalkaliphilus]